MLALPIVFVTFVINFPAGLMVYWITTNMLDDRAAADRETDRRTAEQKT